MVVVFIDAALDFGLVYNDFEEVDGNHFFMEFLTEQPTLEACCKTIEEWFGNIEPEYYPVNLISILPEVEVEGFEGKRPIPETE